MKSIDEAAVRHVAKLARLALSDEEVRRYAGQFEKILGHMEELKKLETSKVQPTSHALGLKNVLREDQVVEFPPEALLEIAPASEAGFYKVQKVIE